MNNYHVVSAATGQVIIPARDLPALVSRLAEYVGHMTVADIVTRTNYRIVRA